MQMSLINRSPGQFGGELYIGQQTMLYLVEAMDKLEDMFVVQLTTLQVCNLLKGCGMEEHASLSKKYSIDGFAVICSLTDLELVRDIRNYFKVD